MWKWIPRTLAIEKCTLCEGGSIVSQEIFHASRGRCFVFSTITGKYFTSKTTNRLEVTTAALFFQCLWSKPFSNCFLSITDLELNKIKIHESLWTENDWKRQDYWWINFTSAQYEIWHFWRISLQISQRDKALISVEDVLSDWRKSVTLTRKSGKMIQYVLTNYYSMVERIYLIMQIQF